MLFLQLPILTTKKLAVQNLLHAEAQYKDFIIFYPLHEMADDAQMKIVALNVRLMKSPDRDSSYAKRAEIELKEFFRKLS